MEVKEEVQIPDSIQTRLDWIVARIVETIHPVRIVLFGSYARGDAHPDSDVDLLIVSEDSYLIGKSRMRILGDLYIQLSKSGVSKDLLLFTESEIARFSQSLNHVVGYATREGKELYARR